MSVTSRVSLVTAEIPKSPQEWLGQVVRLAGVSEICSGVAIKGKAERRVGQTSAEYLGELYEPGVGLRLDLGGPPLAQKFSEALRKMIKSETLGNFAPNNIGLCVGRHKVHFLDAMRFRTRQVGFEFGFWGYGSPSAQAFQEEVLKVPVFIRLREKLETLVGPTEIVFMVFA